MLSNEFLDKLFSNEQVETVPLIYQSIMIHAVEDLLEEEGLLSESEDKDGIRI